MVAPVIMVHGAFCGGWAFDAFRGPFERAGHAVLAPDLRGHGADRRSVVGASMADYARDIAELIEEQAEPPVVVGHSMGGLVAAMAAGRARTAALIQLAPSPPWGVSGFSMEEAISAFGLYALGPFWLQAVDPDRTLMRRFSLDRMAPDARQATAARLGPESGRALWETLNWWLDPLMTTAVDRAKIAAPVLSIAGGRDVVHAPATVTQTATRLGAEYRLMPQMSHWLPGETGHEEVADLCLGWLARVGQPAGV
ncbi:MAG: alpha/beta hydrolase [Caulobacteraceae bacterium]|nr:alpha/beta hydrolase [Caulobacteraceae bacterium]